MNIVRIVNAANVVLNAVKIIFFPFVINVVAEIIKILKEIIQRYHCL